MRGIMTGLLILTIVALAGAQDTGKTAANKEALAIKTGPAQAAQETIAEYLNPGEPIQVGPGRKFTIRIAANPTTGYGWQLAKPLDEKIVVLVTNSYLQEKTDNLRVGVGGHELWTFKAVGAGQTEISLKYVRPWEKDVPPARTNVFSVIVK